jgi:hypothetical protein
MENPATRTLAGNAHGGVWGFSGFRLGNGHSVSDLFAGVQRGKPGATTAKPLASHAGRRVRRESNHPIRLPFPAAAALLLALLA